MSGRMLTATHTLSSDFFAAPAVLGRDAGAAMLAARSQDAALCGLMLRSGSPRLDHARARGGTQQGNDFKLGVSQLGLEERILAALEAVQDDPIIY